MFQVFCYRGLIVVTGLEVKCVIVVVVFVW